MNFLKKWQKQRQKRKTFNVQIPSLWRSNCGSLNWLIWIEDNVAKVQQRKVNWTNLLDFFQFIKIIPHKRDFINILLMLYRTFIQLKYNLFKKRLVFIKNYSMKLVIQISRNNISSYTKINYVLFKKKIRNSYQIFCILLQQQTVKSISVSIM